MFIKHTKVEFYFDQLITDCLDGNAYTYSVGYLEIGHLAQQAVI